MTPRKELESAIARFERWASKQACRELDLEEAGDLVAITALILAARAHLATLPKPLWTVRWDWPMGHSEHTFVHNYLQSQYESLADAFALAEDKMQRGASKVEVIAP